MPLYLVCDGGGTKTEFILFDQAGKVFSRVIRGGANSNFTGAMAAVSAIVDGISACVRMAGCTVEDIDRISLFIPGFADCLPKLAQMLHREDINVQGDDKAAFYGALGCSSGIAVLSGTGSFAIGRNRAGRWAKSGGWGPLYGDFGSGYHIGVMAMVRLAQLYDLGEDGGLMGQLVCGALGASDIMEARGIVYKPGFSRDEIAALCPLVADAARQGDNNALLVLHKAADELAAYAKTVAVRLHISSGDCLPVSLTGGVSKMGDPITGRFAEAVENTCPGCVYQAAKYTPAVGAALYLLSEQAGVNIEHEEIAQNLLKAGDMKC